MWSTEGHGRGGGFHREVEGACERTLVPTEQGSDFPSYKVYTQIKMSPRSMPCRTPGMGRSGLQAPSAGPSAYPALSSIAFQPQGSRRLRNSSAPTVTSPSPKTLIFSSTSEGSPGGRCLLAQGHGVRRPSRAAAHLWACSTEEEGFLHSSQIRGLRQEDWQVCVDRHS